MTTLHRVPVATLTSGMELALYIHEIAGTRGDGPTLGISAAVHGDEPTGTRTVMEIARLYGGGDFRGRLLLLPVANPLAFEANRRATPRDAQNMNRLFPGSSGGWMTEQVAAVMTSSFLEKIDAYVDLHTGTDRPTVDYVYIHNAENLSRAFGSKVLYRAEAGREGTSYEGTSKTVTQGRGVPSVTVELGGGLIDQDPYVARGVAGVQNIMRHLGMLEADPTPAPAQTVVHGIAVIRPRAGGFLFTEAPPLGENIAGGTVLGRVVNPHTFQEVDAIENPVKTGIMILSHLTTNLVQPGDYGYMVGDLDGCERLPAGM